jgi:isocitrate/isopropylmalate dehydrogenase
MLRHLGLNEQARTIESALLTCLGSPQTRTRDLGGTLGTREFTQAVIKAMGVSA